MIYIQLYLRSRRVPLALAVAAGAAVVLWTLWLTLSTESRVATSMVVLTVGLLVSAVSTTLAAPDENLDRTASRRWPWWRAAHLLAAVAVVMLIPLATLMTGAQFGPATLLLRDVAGLFGLTALAATVVGAARSWFVPLGWAVIAALFPQPGLWGALATWPSQPHGNRPAAVVAAAFAVAGLVTYALAGPARREPAE
ncbi:hypothetical protein AB0J83_05150 [Actinoplanes sp. NPDC049596]|uniref:hypothetical protein n=1 Tax=unclassified Actinoplanes TaxID=2626549 RepID=UPI0034362C07